MGGGAIAGLLGLGGAASTAAAGGGIAAGSRTAYRKGSQYLSPDKPGVPGLIGETADLDAAAAEAAERERLRLARRRGRASTILTGPLGDLNPAQLGRKVLTGS
jgi:hypothetical protein